MCFILSRVEMQYVGDFRQRRESRACSFALLLEIKAQRCWFSRVCIYVRALCNFGR